MSTATYVLEVDWANDGSFAEAEDDITEDLLTLECRRGRDYASQLTGRATAGRLIATLLNLEGKYSSFNASSPIAGNIVPGRKVRLRTTAPTAATLWTGYLDRIQPAGEVDGVPVVTLEATGPLGRLNGREVVPAAQADVATGTIVGAILDDAGWPAGERTIDTGQTTISRWYVDRQEALTAAREIEETELGFLYEGEDGKIVFEDRHHRLKNDHTSSQATFSDQEGATLSYRYLEQQDPLREIFNEVTAVVEPLQAAGAEAVLWTLRDEQPTIRAGESITRWAVYPKPEVDPTNGAYVESWVTPVVGTDITQTGVNNADLAVTVSRFANSMKITITNNGSATATITLLQARGTAVTRREPVRVSHEDSASQTAYGQRTYRFPGPWLPDTNVALDFCQYVVSRYKDPVPVLTMMYVANKSSDHMTQALTRKISDRIAVVATGSRTQLGIDGDFFVEAITHRIVDAGRYHEVVYELSDAGGDAGYWVLGVSELGVNTKLAY